MTTGPQNAVPFGKYLLLKRLAVGGMAELYLAKDPAAERLVVIKRILPYLAQETEFVRMFLDEARIASQLHHPNIIQMHELGHLEGSIFIAMEFVEGVDLRKILQQEQRRNSTVSPDIAAFLTARLCEGLHYAHNRIGADGRPLGIIHRDVSPQNMMVGYGGEVKLVDFGISKATSFMERSKPGVIKGKFLYLSPEQLTQDRIDHRADLFAIGTMLYEVTTGKSPFYKPTTEAVIYAIRAEDPPPPHLLNSSYPAELSRIIMRCLLKDRSRRYQQAGEVHADLEAWMRKESPTSPETVIDYVGKLFGDQEERTAIFIPPNARSERTRVDGPRKSSSEGVPTTPGLVPAPTQRTNSNPTLPLGPFKSINEETTKPIATALNERTNPSVGRRPTPAPDSVLAVGSGADPRTQTVRPADIARALGARPNTASVTQPDAATRKASPFTPDEATAALSSRQSDAEIEPTAISGAGRLITGDSLVELTPNAPRLETPATNQASPVRRSRERDTGLYEERVPPPVPSYLPPEPETNGARPSNIRGSGALPLQPQTDPGSAPRSKPGDTFADPDDVASFDGGDEESTLDYRASSLSDLKQAIKRQDVAEALAREGLLTRKPWLIAVAAFLAVLIAGLLVALWARPDRPPRPVPTATARSAAAPTAAATDPESAEPEAPVGDLADPGKTVVKFTAATGTLIEHDGTRFVPNKEYALFPGSFSLLYRCPGKKGKQPQALNMTANIEHHSSTTQIIPINCR